MLRGPERMLGKLFGCVRPVAQQRCTRPQTHHKQPKPNDLRLFYALEWTRTTTGRKAHKALNLIRLCHIRPPASRSSVPCGFADASDTSDEMTCVRDVSRACRGQGEGGVPGWRRRRGRSLACRLVPTDPTSVRWTLHAVDKAQQLGFARRDVESALLEGLEGHRKRRRNKGRARWLVTSGRLVIAYEYPDGEDLLVAGIVTVWRRR
jgi:hypothetical protein